MRLSPRQRDVFHAIVGHIDRHGAPPTMREISQAVGIASKSQIHTHLVNLERKGYIRRSDRISRGITVVMDVRHLPPSVPPPDPQVLQQVPLDEYLLAHHGAAVVVDARGRVQSLLRDRSTLDEPVQLPGGALFFAVLHPDV